MTNSKEKPEERKLPEKIFKYWYISKPTKKIKKLSGYHKTKKIVSFDSDHSIVVDEEGKAFQIYYSFKEATISLLKMEIEEKRTKWQECVDDSMKLNDEIGKLLDKLDKHREGLE